MARTTWIRTGLCLLAVLVLLCMGLALAEGETAALSLSVKETTVERGEFFEVTVAGDVAGAYGYNVRLLDSKDEKYDWAFEYDAGKFYISSAKAPAGDYRLVAYAVDANDDELCTSDEVTVQVTESSAEEKTIVFKVNHRENPSVANFIYVSAYAPGADYVYIDWVGYDEFAPDLETPNGLNLKVWDEPGEQEFYAVATYSDGTVVRTDSVTVNAESLPTAGEVTITDMPTHLVAGGAFTAGYSVERAVDSELRVKVFTADSWEMVYNEKIDDSDGSDSFTIPAQQQGEDGKMYATFEAGRLYEIYVILTPADKAHYGQAWENRNFDVVSAADDRVQLRIDGQTDEVEAIRGQEVPVEISVQDATAVRFCVGEECDNLRDWGEWEDWSQSGEIQFNRSFWDKCIAYAEACFDEDPWADDANWVRSNTVIVKANADRALSAPMAQTSSSVFRGELLEVHVREWDERTQWRYALLRDAEWNEILSVDVDSDDFYLPTAQLEPGEYILNVGSGAVGLDDGIATRWFKVTDPEAGSFTENVHWAFSEEEAVTQQRVYFSAYATDPEVTHIRVEMTREGIGDLYGEWDSDSLITGWFNADQADTYVFTAYLYKDGAVEPVAQSSYAINVTANGTLDAVQLQGIPSEMEMYTPVRGSIGLVERAEWYTLDFGYNRDGEWEWFEHQDQTNKTIYFNGRLFNEEGTYRLVVGAHAYGMNSSYTEADIVVKPQELKSVTLSIRGETETLSCAAHTELPMVVIAPGASDVEYSIDGNEWMGINHLENSIGYSGSVNFAGGNYTVQARARAAEDGNWIYSNSVTVKASMTDGLGASVLDAPDTVVRGEALEISFTAVDHASQYVVCIFKGDDNIYGFGLEPGEHKLPTAMLEEGTYRLVLNYCGTGYAWRSLEQTFTVTDAEQEDVVTFLGADKIKCNEKVLVSVYAPGATGIRVYEYETSNNEERLYEECEGNTYTHNFHRDHPDTVRYSASVSYNGEDWSDRIDIGTLYVTESLQLDAPEIVVGSDNNPIPTLINAGEGIEFSFTEVQNAAIYSYQVRDNDILDGNDNLMDGWFDYPANVKLPASLFRAGHTYRLDVLVSAPGYETNYTAYGFAVRSDLADGEIDLTVNGKTNTCEGWVSDSFHVVADAPDNATAIIVSDGMDWRWQPGSHFEDDFGYDFGGQVTLIARYTTDWIGNNEEPDWENVGWAGYSNPVTLTIQSKGNMPQVEVDKTALASVTRGDWLEIQVSNAATFQDEKYENLWLHAEAGIPEEGRWYGCYDWDGKDTIKLPTAELEAGTYELHVRAGADGYVGSTSVYTLSVDDPGDGAIHGGIDKTEVVTGEDFTISIYAPGANQVKIFEGYGEIDCRDGDTYVQRHSHGEATELRFHAKAYYSETDAWVKTEPITVTVTAPYGSITAAELGLVMPTRLEADKELTIAWNDLGLRHYDVEIVRLRDDVRVWHSWNNHGETEVTVPLTMPEEYDGMEQVLETGGSILEAGEFYRVNLYFQRDGYNSLHIEKQIVVVIDDMYAQGLTLMVDDQTDAYATLVNVDVPVKITAPQNATAILAWNGYDWDMYTGNEVVTNWAWGDANERMLYARYTTDTIEDGKDWPAYGWSRVSNIVTVNVTRNGYVEAPVVTLSSDAPLRGEALSFTVSNPESGFNWTVCDPVDDWSWDWSDWGEQASHEIDTFDLQVDRTYLLCLNKYGTAGYEGTSVEIPFTVTVNGTAAAPQVEVETSVAQGDVLTIKIKNPEAGKLFRAWFRQEDRDMHFMSDWNGVDTIYLPSFNLTAGLDTKLYIQNEGLIGQERNCTVLPIKVDAPSGKLSLCLEKTSLVTQEETYIVAYAPGAQSIRIYAYNAGEPENPFWDDTVEDDVWQDRRNFTGEAGTKIVTAVATYSDRDPKTQTMEVSVTAPGGDLPRPVIDLPESVEAGAELSFSVTAQYAEWWFVEVYDQTDEGRQLYRWDVENYKASRSFTVPAAELVEGHTYGVNVYAARYAWNSANIFEEFTVGAADKIYDGNVLELPTGLKAIEEEAFVGISARTVVIPDGTTSIGSLAFADCGSLKYVVIPDSVTSIAANAFARSNVTFVCNTGSPAYAYAKERGIPTRSYD